MTIYLYIKQHSVTKLLYFGFTKQNDPYKYNGSGKYWKPHIKKHGREHVVTLKVFSFKDQKEATAFALQFSEYWNIVESPYWANLVPENASSGLGNTGKTHSKSIEARLKIGAASKGHKTSEETRQKISKATKGVYKNNTFKYCFNHLDGREYIIQGYTRCILFCTEQKLSFNSFQVQIRQNKPRAVKGKNKGWIVIRV